MRFCHMSSLAKGRNGASSLASVTRHSKSVQCASSLSLPRPGAQKRSRLRRTYQLESASTKLVRTCVDS